MTKLKESAKVLDSEVKKKVDDGVTVYGERILTIKLLRDWVITIGLVRRLPMHVYACLKGAIACSSCVSVIQFGVDQETRHAENLSARL